MGLLDSLLGNGRKDKADELKPVMKRLDDLEELLNDLKVKSDDKFETVLKGIDCVVPHEKGQYLNRLEEKISKAKNDMVYDAILGECARDSKSFAELRRSVRERTKLNVSGSFLDSCIKRLAYEGKLERVGSRFVSSGSIRNTESSPNVKFADKKAETEFISEIMEEPEEGNGKTGRETEFRQLRQPPWIIAGMKAEEKAHGGNSGNGKAASEGNGGKLGGANKIGSKEGNGGSVSVKAEEKSNGANKFEMLDVILSVVGELEEQSGAAPVEAVITESTKRGVPKEEANVLIDEHLMITGHLYEPKQGHVKTVKPSLTA